MCRNKKQLLSFLHTECWPLCQTQCLENKYCLLAVLNFDGDKRVPGWVWVQAVIVADFAYQFLFFCFGVPVLHHRVTPTEVLVL